MKSSAVIPDTAMTGSAGALAQGRNDVDAAGVAEEDVDDRRVKGAFREGLQSGCTALGLLDLEMIDPKHHRDHRADALLVVDNENARHWEQLPIKSSGPNLEPAAAEGHYGTVQ